MTRPSPLFVALSFSAVLGSAAFAASLPNQSAWTMAADETKPTEFVAAFNDLDLEFDPHHSIYSAEAQVFTALYEGLFSYDPESLDPQRAVCKSYVRSKDGLTYTFTLREKAAWSDGTPLMARDFRDAWLRVLSPQEKADYAAFFDVIAGAKEYRLGISKDPETVGLKILGDKVLEVKLASPAAYFTRLLCHHSFSPIHPSMLQVRDWQNKLPFPVNGPYAFTAFEKGELRLTKNANYWDSASVMVEKLRFLFSDDDADATRRFDNGEIHWLAGPMDVDALLDRQAIKITPMFGTHYWFFDCGTEPWSDSRIRRALTLLVPWKEVRNSESYLMPADTLVLPFDGYEKAEGIQDANEEEARKLLAEAGKPDGKGLAPLVILLPSGGEDAKRIGEILKAAWERLPGLSVELRETNSARYFDAVRAGPVASGYTIAVTTWIGDFADPLAFLQMWTSDSNLNDARFIDPEFDRLIADSSAEEGKKRLDILAEAESRLLGSGACLPIYHSLAANIVDTNFIEGWYTNALDIHPFKTIAFGQPKVRSNVAKSIAPHKPTSIGWHK